MSKSTAIRVPAPLSPIGGIFRSGQTVLDASYWIGMDFGRDIVIDEILAPEQTVEIVTASPPCAGFARPMKDITASATVTRK